MSYYEMTKAELLVEVHELAEELAEVTEERDELAAELERVKAERDELKSNSFSDDLKTMSILAETDQHIQDCKTFLEEFKNLSSLKSRLPVNADGDNVFIGDEVWVHGYHVFAFEIVGIRWASHDRSKGYEVKEKGSDLNGWWPVESCHSTAESCRTANESKEGE